MLRGLGFRVEVVLRGLGVLGFEVWGLGPHRV